TSRLLFAYGRDGMIIGSERLSKLSPRTKMPVTALIVAGFIPSVIVLIGYFLENTVRTIVTFGSAGIYVAFQMVVLGAIFARIKGWKPAGQFQLRGWGWSVNIIAFVFGISAIVDMMWPRSPSDPWYLNYGMILTSCIVLACGAVYMLAFSPYEKGNTPSGDAHLLWRAAAGSSANSTD
ncbi:MAG: amino acid permease, partial [Candidatus Acidiferrales bacterium]